MTKSPETEALSPQQIVANIDALLARFSNNPELKKSLLARREKFAPQEQKNQVKVAPKEFHLPGSKFIFNGQTSQLLQELSKVSETGLTTVEIARRLKPDSKNPIQYGFSILTIARNKLKEGKVAYQIKTVFAQSNGKTETKYILEPKPREVRDFSGHTMAIPGSGLVLSGLSAAIAKILSESGPIDIHTLAGKLYGDNRENHVSSANTGLVSLKRVLHANNLPHLLGVPTDDKSKEFYRARFDGKKGNYSFHAQTPESKRRYHDNDIVLFDITCKDLWYLAMILNTYSDKINPRLDQIQKGLALPSRDVLDSVEKIWRLNDFPSNFDHQSYRQKIIAKFSSAIKDAGKYIDTMDQRVQEPNIVELLTFVFMAGNIFSKKETNAASILESIIYDKPTYRTNATGEIELYKPHAPTPIEAPKPREIVSAPPKTRVANIMAEEVQTPDSLLASRLKRLFGQENASVSPNTKTGEDLPKLDTKEQLKTRIHTAVDDFLLKLKAQTNDRSIEGLAKSIFYSLPKTYISGTQVALLTSKMGMLIGANEYDSVLPSLKNENKQKKDTKITLINGLGVLTVHVCGELNKKHIRYRVSDVEVAIESYLAFLSKKK